jgi:hypothetical protein
MHTTTIAITIMGTSALPLHLYFFIIRSFQIKVIIAGRFLGRPKQEIGLLKTRNFQKAGLGCGGKGRERNYPALPNLNKSQTRNAKSGFGGG